MRNKFIILIRVLGLMCGIGLMCEPFYKYITNQPATKDVYISAMVGWFCTIVCEITFWVTDVKCRKIEEKYKDESNTKQ